MSFGARMLRGGGDLALWRSEEMELVQVIVPAEAAHGTVAKLGALGTCEFRDLNAGRSAFQRTYANQVKRCDELERKLRVLRDEVRAARPPPAPDRTPGA